MDEVKKKELPAFPGETTLILVAEWWWGVL